MKKKVLISVGLSSLLLSITGAVIFVVNPIISTGPGLGASYYVFESMEELEKRAEFIVTVRPTQSIEESRTVINRFPDGDVEDSYSVTQVRIDKILKGKLSTNEISVIQAATINSPIPGFRFLNRIEDYTLLKKGKYYLLFLSKVEGKDLYSVLSINQGKFNLDNLDQEELGMSSRNPQYSGLKSRVMKKYIPKIFNSTTSTLP